MAINYFAMTPSCLPSTELAKYAKTKLVLNIGNSDLRCMLKVIIKYGKFKLLFLRRLHGIVLKYNACIVSIFICPHSTNEILSQFLASSLPFRCDAQPQCLKYLLHQYMCYDSLVSSRVCYDFMRVVQYTRTDTTRIMAYAF